MKGKELASIKDGIKEMSCDIKEMSGDIKGGIKDMEV